MSHASTAGGGDEHLDKQLQRQVEDYKHHFAQLEAELRKDGSATDELHTLLQPQLGSSDELIHQFRESRKAALEKAADLDSRLLSPKLQAEEAWKDVLQASEPVVAGHEVSSMLQSFFDWMGTLQRTQAKLLRLRACRLELAGGVSTEDPGFKAFREALKVLQVGASTCEWRAKRLNSLDSAAGPTVAELVLRLRHHAVEQAASAQLKSFFAQIKYMNYSGRVRLWRRALELRAVASQAAEHPPASIVPLGVASRKQLEKALQELGPSYGCTGSLSIYKGKAFAHQVTMEFPRLFKLQESQLNFAIADSGSPAQANLLSTESENQAADDGVGPPIALEPSTWVLRLPWKPCISREAQEQNILLQASHLGSHLTTRIQHALPSYARHLLETTLASTGRKGVQQESEPWEPNLDALLVAEQAFLKVSDADAVARKFHEVGDAHEASMKVSADTPEEEQGSDIQGPLLRAHGLLRHLELRRMRRKLLDFLNFYRAAQRWLLAGHLMVTEGETQEAVIHTGKTPAAPASQQPQKSTAAWQYSPEELASHTRACSLPSLLGNVGDPPEWLRVGGFETKGGDVQPVTVGGEPVMHQAALDDHLALEEEMLMIGSYYIHKYEAGSPEDPEQKSVDRTGVLFDLYAAELQYHAEKQRLLLVYLEIFEHTCDPEERQSLSQRIVDIIASRPLLDLDGAYFCEAYSTSACSFEARTALLQKLLSHQIQMERSVWSTAAACCEGDAATDVHWHARNLGLAELIHPLEGLPLPVHSRADKNICLLPGTEQVDITEFFASTQHVWRAELILEAVHQELVENLRPTSTSLSSQLERACYVMACELWQQYLEKQDTPSSVWQQHDNPEVLRQVLLEAIRQLNALGNVERTSSPALVLPARFELEVDGDMMQAFADIRKRSGTSEGDVGEALRQLLIELLEHLHVRQRLRTVSLEVASLERSLAAQASLCGVRLDALRPNALLQQSWSESRSHSPIGGKSANSQVNAWMNEKFAPEFFAGTVACEMAQLDLSNPRSLVMHCASMRLQEMRLLYQNQLAYHALLLACVQGNALLLDPSSRQKELADVELIGPSRDLVVNDVCVARLKKLGETAALGAPVRREEALNSKKAQLHPRRAAQPQSKSRGNQAAYMDATRYARNLQTPTSLTEPMRSHLSALYEEEAVALKQECLGITEMERRVGILKYRILMTLSFHMAAVAHSTFLRVQAAHASSGLRRLAALIPLRLSPFAAAQGSERRKVLLEKDGLIGNICTIPSTLEALQLWSNNLPWDFHATPLEAQVQEFWPRTAHICRHYQLEASGGISRSVSRSVSRAGAASHPIRHNKSSGEDALPSPPSTGAPEVEPYALQLLKLQNSLSMLFILHYAVASIDGDQLVFLRMQRLVRMSDADDESHDFVGDLLSETEPSFQTLERMSQTLATILQAPGLSKQPRATQAIQVLHGEIQSIHCRLVAVLRASAQQALQDAAKEDAQALQGSVQHAEHRAYEVDDVSSFLPLFFRIRRTRKAHCRLGEEMDALLPPRMLTIPMAPLLSTFCFLPPARQRKVSSLHAELLAKRDALRSHHIPRAAATSRLDARFFGIIYLHQILQESVALGQLDAKDVSACFSQVQAVQEAWEAVLIEKLSVPRMLSYSGRGEATDELQEQKAELQRASHMAPKAREAAKVEAEMVRLEGMNTALLQALEQVMQAAVSERVRLELVKLAHLRCRQISPKLDVLSDAAAARLRERDGNITAAKVDIVLHAVNKLKTRAMHVRMGQKGISDERAYVFHEDDLNRCVEEVSFAVRTWGMDILRDRQALVQDVTSFLEWQAGVTKQQAHAYCNDKLARLNKQGWNEAMQSAVVTRSCQLVSEVDRLHRVIRDLKDVSCQLDHRLSSEMWQRVRSVIAVLSDRLEQATGNFHESRMDCAGKVGMVIRSIREHTHAQLAALAAKNFEVQTTAASSMPTGPAAKQVHRGAEANPPPITQYRVSDDMHTKLGEVARRDDVLVLHREIEDLKNRRICLRAFYLMKREATLQKFQSRMQALQTTLQSNRSLWERYATVSKRHELVESSFAQTARELTIAEGEEDTLRSKVESVVEHRKKLQSDQRNKSRQLNNLAAKVKEHQMHGHQNLQRMHRVLLSKQETLQRLRAQRAEDELVASQASLEGRAAASNEKALLQKQRIAKEDANVHLVAIKSEMSQQSLTEEQRFKQWRSRVDEVKRRLHQAEDENKRLRNHLHEEDDSED